MSLSAPHLNVSPIKAHNQPKRRTQPPKPRPWSALCLAILLALAVAAAQPSAAQSIAFAGVQTTLAHNFNSPAGLAFDANGNLFVTDSDANTVSELSAAGGYATANILARSYTANGGFSNPAGIAVDTTGNVFVADDNHHQVKEILAAGGYTVVKAIGSGFIFPSHLAVDRNGNVFVADIGSGAVEEIVAAGGYVTVKTLLTTVALGAVAVDASGNVFFSDIGNPLVQEVREILADGGYTTVVTLASAYTSNNGFNLITALALDSQGNLLVGDAGSSNIFVDPKQSSIKDILAAGGYANVETVASDLIVPSAIAVVGEDIYFSTVFFGGNITELQTQSVNFGSANVCPAGQTTPAPCGKTLTFTYNVASGGKLGAPQFLSQGTPNLDFAYASGGTCSASVKQGTCTMNVAFAPFAPGQRNGMVEVVDGSGNMLAETPVYGTGLGPAIAFSAPTKAPIGVGFKEPAGAAIDGKGNLFVADSGGRVYEVLAAGGYSTTHALAAGFAFKTPKNVAVDGGGNVFVTDSGAGRVYEIPADGGYANVSTIAPAFAFGQPNGIAVDGSGNLFVADSGNFPGSPNAGEIPPAIYRIPSAGGYASVDNLTANTPAGAYFQTQQPAGIAVDGSGNLFVADPTGAAVFEIPAAGGYSTLKSIGNGGFISLNGWNYPTGVAVDASGSVYVADSGYPTLLVILPADGYSDVVTLGGGFGAPLGVALDASGNVFVADGGNGGAVPPAAEVLSRSLPPTLSFAPTPVGAASSDSPQSVLVQNIGNANLVGSAFAVSPNWIEVAGDGRSEDCTATFSHAPGSECNISIGFEPSQAGPLTGHVVLQDNALNGTDAIQSIPLSGTGVGTVATPTFNPPGGTYSSAQTVAIKDTTPGAIIYFTTNGTTPTTSSIRYCSPTKVSANETIKAIAVAPNYANSAVATAVYIIK